MALQIRRGTDIGRQTLRLLEGELVFATDTKRLYVGDGVTLGGVPVELGNIVEEITLDTLAGVEITNPANNDAIVFDGSKWVNRSPLLPKQIENTVDNLFNTVHNGITFYYNGTNIVASVIKSLQNETAPALGGNLDLNYNNVVGQGNINLTGNCQVSGTLAGTVLSLTPFETYTELSLITPATGSMAYVRSEGRFYGFIDNVDSAGTPGWVVLNI